MDKRAIEEVCNYHEAVFNTNTINAFNDILSRVRHGQYTRYEYLASDLQRVINMIDPKKNPNLSSLQLAVNTLDELIKGLTNPEHHKDIELVGIPNRTTNVHSVPYYPIDDLLENKLDGDSLNDPINPNHYKTNSGVQTIDIAELFPYALGNAIKYAWRAGKKDDLKQDLEKCEWYLNRAMVNGEIVFLKPFTQATYKAWHKFKKVENELPKRNAEVLSNILQGNLKTALNILDSWVSELDDE